MIRNKVVVVSLVTLALSGACLGACSGNKDSATTEEAPQTEQVATGTLTVGTTEEGAHELMLTNGSDVTLVALQVRAQGAADFEPDLLAGQTVAAGDDLCLRVPAAWDNFDVRIAVAGAEAPFELGPISAATTARMQLAKSADAVTLMLEKADGSMEIADVIGAPAAEAPATEEPAPEEPAPEAQAETDTTTEATEEAGYDETGEASADDGYDEEYGYDASDGYDGSYDDYGDYDVPMDAPSSSDQSEDSCIDDVMLK